MQVRDHSTGSLRRRRDEMRTRTAAQWLAAALAVPVAAGSLAPTFGVHIDRLPLYAALANSPAPAVFACVDGSGDVPASAVNDDYCDCPDGSDEPGTSACDSGTFYCANAGHIPATIRSSVVNDGVCDEKCCDGSDEYSGIIACVNTCVAQAQAHSLADIADEAIRSQGAMALLAAMYDSPETSTEIQKDFAKAQEELSLVKSELSGLEEHMHRLESLSAIRKSNDEKAKQKEICSVFVEPYKTSLDELIRAVGELRATLDTHGFASMRVIEMANQALDRIRMTNDSNVTPELSSEDIQELEINDVSKQKEEKTHDLTRLEEKIRKLEARSTIDYGPNNSFLPFKGECTAKQIHEYKYSVCVLESARQGSTNLGSFTSWGPDGPEKYKQMMFTGGEKCWNGPDRSAKIYFECGAKLDIVSVEEPSKCEYIIQMTIPAVCTITQKDREKFDDMKPHRPPRRPDNTESGEHGHVDHINYKIDLGYGADSDPLNHPDDDYDDDEHTEL